MNVARRIAQCIVIIVVLLTSVLPATAQNEITFKEIATIGRGAIEQIEWSPDGTQIAVVTIRGVWIYQADDLTVEPRLIDVRDRRPKMFGRQYPVSYPENFFMPIVAFDSKWERLAVIEYGGGVNIFDMGTGKKLVSVDYSSAVQSLAFSSDGRTLALGRNAGSERGEYGPKPLAEFLLVDVGTGDIRRTIKVDHLWPDAMTFTPDDRYLGVAGSASFGDVGGYGFYMIDLGSGTIYPLEQDDSAEDRGSQNSEVPPVVVMQAKYPDRYSKVVFVSGSEPFTVTYIDTSGDNYPFVLSPDVKKYGVFNFVNSFSIREVSTKKELVTYPLVDSSFKLKGAFSGDGSRIAVSNDSDKLTIWVLDSTKLNPDYGRNVGCFYLDSYCVTATTAHEVVVGALGWPIESISGNFAGKQFLSPDRRWSVRLPFEKEWREQDTTVSLTRQSDKQVFQLKLKAFSSVNDEIEYVSHHNIQDVYFDAASSMVVVAFSSNSKGGTYNDYVRVWKIDGDTPQVTPIAVLEAPGPPQLLRHDPNTKSFFISTRYGNVYIWNPVTNKVIGALNLPDEVLGMEFSTSDNVLITRSADGLIRLWRTE